jgi:hypothetical protein
MQIYCHSGIAFQKFGTYGSHANEPVGHRRRETHMAARRGRLHHAVVFGRLSSGRNTSGEIVQLPPGFCDRQAISARFRNVGELGILAGSRSS